MPTPAPGTAPSGFAAAPFLLLALGLGVVATYRLELVGTVLQPPMLVAILVGNVAALLYRVVAAVDAYRVVVFLNRWDEGAGRLGPSRSILAPISLAGLLGVVLVMGGAHAAVAYYDLQALDLVQGIFNPIGEEDPTPDPSASVAPSPDGSADASEPPLSTPPPGADGRPGRALPGAVGRQGAAQRPPDRVRPAPRRGHLQHGHAHRRQRRSGERPGRDVQHAARHGPGSRSSARRARSSARRGTARSTASSSRRAPGPTSSRAAS